MAENLAKNTAKNPENNQNFTIPLPQDVAALLAALHAAGFAAFAVGGCVRDSLLGKMPHDWDVATAATPPQTKAVFAGRRLLLQGEKHGTVAVDTGTRFVEITTFRTEGAYTDARRPSEVHFVPDVQADLLRRDFTVNALAYAPETGLVDVCGGVADLQSGVLRAVGDADARFGEDALRILRCVRFAAQLQFAVEENTESALRRNANLLQKLAKERVGQELRALLHCDACGKTAARYADVLAAATGGTVGEKTQKTLCAMDEIHQTPLWAQCAETAQLPWAPACFAVRCALLCTALDVPPQRLVALGFGKQTEKQVQCILAAVPPYTSDAPVVRLFLHNTGTENAALCFAYHVALGESATLAAAEKAACEILARGDALQTADLCATGADAAACGLHGAEIGKALALALAAVMQDELANERQALCAFLRAYAHNLHRETPKNTQKV